MAFLKSRMQLCLFRGAKLNEADKLFPYSQNVSAYGNLKIFPTFHWFDYNLFEWWKHNFLRRVSCWNWKYLPFNVPFAIVGLRKTRTFVYCNSSSWRLVCGKPLQRTKSLNLTWRDQVHNFLPTIVVFFFFFSINQVAENWSWRPLNQTKECDK